MTEDTYLESMNDWSRNISDTELLNEYNKLQEEYMNHLDKIEQMRMELSKWELSLEMVNSNQSAVEDKINERGLFGNPDETPEGPERYYTSPGELW